MQTATGQPHFAGADFKPGDIANYDLTIDCTAAGGPMLALFDSQKKLGFLGTLEFYDRCFPDQPFKSLELRSIGGIVPEIDLMVIPAEIYEDGQRDNYLTYLRDDGVTAVEVNEFKSLSQMVLYRSDLSFCSTVLDHFPRLDLIPVSGLLINALTQKAGRAVLGIHKGDNQITFYLVSNGELYYHNLFQSVNEDDFNYHLIQVLKLGEERNFAVDVIFSGDVVAGDSYYQRVIKYISADRILDPLVAFGLDIPEELHPYANRLVPSYLLIQSSSELFV